MDEIIHAGKEVGAAPLVDLLRLSKRQHFMESRTSRNRRPITGARFIFLK